MGELIKALSPPSSYAAKKGTLWDEIAGVIDLCMTQDQLREAAAWIDSRELEIPGGWREPIADRLTLKAEEIASEDVGLILRERFDF